MIWSFFHLSLEEKKKKNMPTTSRTPSEWKDAVVRSWPHRNGLKSFSFRTKEKYLAPSTPFQSAGPSLCGQAFVRHVSSRAGPPSTCCESHRGGKGRYSETEAHSQSRQTGGRPRRLPRREGSHLLALGSLPITVFSGRLSAAACFNHWADMVTGDPMGPQPDRTDTGGWATWWETTIGRDFGGQKWKTFFLFSFLFFSFLSSPMWKRHSARRKTGADRTQRQRDGWAAYPPPDLKERGRKRLTKGCFKNGETLWGDKPQMAAVGVTLRRISED